MLRVNSYSRTKPDADTARIDSVYETGWSGQFFLDEEFVGFLHRAPCSGYLMALRLASTLKAELDVLLNDPRCFLSRFADLYATSDAETSEELRYRTARGSIPVGPADSNPFGFDSRFPHASLDLPGQQSLRRARVIRETRTRSGSSPFSDLMA